MAKKKKAAKAKAPDKVIPPYRMAAFSGMNARDHAKIASAVAAGANYMVYATNSVSFGPDHTPKKPVPNAGHPIAFGKSKGEARDNAHIPRGTPGYRCVVIDNGMRLKDEARRAASK